MTLLIALFALLMSGIAIAGLVYMFYELFTAPMDDGGPE